MSGHNKWSSIKHKKQKADAARGKVFSRLVKEISVAAREGGGDLESNSRLRVAVETAKSQNMPSDNIERAIKRGTGELEGISYEEIIYEAYGPGGVAIIIEVLTDNKNRTAADVRHLLSKHGGHLGSRNSVAYMFNRVGKITIDGTKYSEEQVLEAGLDAGLEDVQKMDDLIVASTMPSDVFDVMKALVENGVVPDSAEVTKEPENYITLSSREAEKTIELLEALEESDDVQAIHTNFEMQEE
ncbi:MAG: YebC/PmpR family DNA-binding transcriptional regulator [Candidatus Fermentibacteraceae bacterium]|nr:YebC/PmpR family DNA-binding transcriptional regulator [Candidatus Fermentibacteraceae bacterium]MBN2607944.1 YebC/PmpR family DNA-binding transcriptional regulator [Candidatus Fermentibacteraceae bacterium]